MAVAHHTPRSYGSPLALAHPLYPCAASVFRFFWYTLQTSTRLHNDALLGVLHAPMSFFNSNPAGRILNKFSKEMDLVDEALPSTLYVHTRQPPPPSTLYREASMSLLTPWSVGWGHGMPGMMHCSPPCCAWRRSWWPASQCRGSSS